MNARPGSPSVDVADLDAASFNLTDSPRGKYLALRFFPNTGQYYNIRAFSGGDIAMPLVTVEKTIDTSQAFVDMEMRLRSVEAVRDVTTTPTALTVGRRGVDSSAPATNEWLYENRSVALNRVQDFGQPLDGATQDLEVDARPYAQVPIIVRNDAEIDARGFVWGSPFHDPTVRSAHELLSIGRADIERASKYFDKSCRYLTYETDLEVGSRQTVTLEDRRLRAEAFVITRLHAQNLPGSYDKLGFEVEAYVATGPEMLAELARRAFGSSQREASPDTDEALVIPALMTPDAVSATIVFTIT